MLFFCANTAQIKYREYLMDGDLWPSSVIFRADELVAAKEHVPVTFYTGFRDLNLTYDETLNTSGLVSHLERLITNVEGFDALVL